VPSTPPHEHITNPPTDTVQPAAQESPSSNSLLLVFAALVFTSMLILTSRNKESN
jgi:hypothetical protein